MLSLLQNKLIEAMKNKDKPTTIGIRNIIGKIKAKQIDKKTILEEYQNTAYVFFYEYIPY